MKINSNKEP